MALGVHVEGVGRSQTLENLQADLDKGDLCLSAQSLTGVLSCLSCVRLLVTPWSMAQQAPLSINFSRQEYWSG